MALSSLISLFPSCHQLTLNPNATHRRIFFSSPTMEKRSPVCNLNSPEMQSFAVATGDVILSLLARVVGQFHNLNDGIEYPVTMFERTGVEPDVELERDQKVLTSPGFSFSSGGLMFPYHLGAAHFLIEKGYIKDTTPLAGSSAGAIICAMIAAGCNMEDVLKTTKTLADDCRLRGTASRIGAALRDLLQEILPDDAHIRSNGRIRVGVTQILWRPMGLIVDQFHSKKDLIDAVMTSSFIPGYLAPEPATIFRNRLCIDGGLTLFMPPTSAAKTVRVCPYSASGMGLQGIEINPDCNPQYRATPRELFKWSLEPADDLIIDRLFGIGYLDAAVWGEKNPAEKILIDGY